MRAARSSIHSVPRSIAEIFSSTMCARSVLKRPGSTRTWSAISQSA
ncbi:MAG: hypothetical protein IPH13_00425 [Planctomycetes bacterium]|nr:hypothetical protein [Planctomycetota bacterium]